ncbi:MAG: peptidase M23 [Alteromonadaceae bacterium]|nr:peptidase M23 [Alteromonadaceae bacterium]
MSLTMRTAAKSGEAPLKPGKHLGSACSRIPRGLLSVMLGLALSVLVLCGQAWGEPQVSPRQLEQLEKRIQAVNRWLNSAEENRSDLARKVKSLEQDIGRINSRLHRLGEQQQQTQAQLATLDQEAETLRARLEKQRGSLKAQLLSAWKLGDAPGLKVLLNESDPQQLSRQMAYHDYISQDAVERLNKFQRTLSALRENRAAALVARNELSEARATAQAQRRDLEERQVERRETLAALDKEIRQKKSELERLQADRERLEELLKRVQEAVQNLELPDESTPFSALAGKLPRPAPGKVLAHYGEPMAGGKLRRNGTIIAVSAGAAIRAVHYGRVVFSDWLRGFGLLVILDHGDGYMSLYGQNDGLLKNVGDWVSAGEAIALGGNSGGNPPGLYFEIRKHGKPIDPGKWLGKQ